MSTPISGGTAFDFGAAAQATARNHRPQLLLHLQPANQNRAGAYSKAFGWRASPAFENGGSDGPRNCRDHGLVHASGK